MSGDRLIDRLRAASQRRPVRIFDTDGFVTPMTMADSANVQAKFPDDTAKRQAEILIMKCRDAAGEPLFTGADRDMLANEINGAFFSDVWAAINGSSVDDQAEK